MKTIIVGRGQKANQKIEINDPSVSREHCKLTDNGNGTYTLENLGRNGTFVNGVQILKTTVTPNTTIQLGANTFVRVSDLIPNATPEKISDDGFDISQLESIWETYHDSLIQIQQTQRNNNLLRSASPIFTIGSGAIATLAKTMEWPETIFIITTALTVFGLLLMIFSFIRSFNDNSIQQKEDATEHFQLKYVCPNPKCKHFMGNQPYKIIKQNKNCPWCKCKFTT